jgi:hypothetical protein
MEENKEINISLIILGLICVILNFVGLVILGTFLFFKNIPLPAFAPVLLGIGGFAAIVNFFVRTDNRKKITNFVVKPGNAIAGIIFIFVACTMV